MFYPKSPFLNNAFVETEILRRNAAAITELLPWLCQPPRITTYRVNLLKTTVDEFKSHLENQLGERYKNPPKVYTIQQLPEVVCIGTIKQMPETDPQQKEVIVDSCCAAALLRGAHIYAPGVLAMETGTKQQESVQVYADLDGQCKKGTNIRYNSDRKMFVGIGRVQMQRHQLYGEQVTNAGIAVKMEATKSGVPAIGDLSSSEVLLQNLPSIVCVRVLAPQPGERVLDMCAAPGNKTTHIVEMMGDCGLVIALDKTESKIKLVREKIAKYGYQSVHAYAYDATKSYASSAANDDLISPPPFTANSFDRILLDVPCSALGNRPLLYSKITSKMLKSYPNVQRKLFENAVELLKPLGVLVYSTCTVTESENEQIVAWALQKFPQLELVDAQPKFGGAGLSDIGLNERQICFVQRFGPEGTNFDKNIDSVGFFIAKFIKRGNIIDDEVEEQT